MLQEIQRAHAPALSVPDSLPVPHTEPYVPKDFIPCFLTEGGHADIVRMELLFTAGPVFDQVPLTATSVNATLIEGTNTFGSEEISERLDSLGARIDAEVNKDRASVVLTALNRNLPQAIEIFASVCTEPVFPKAEFDIYVKRAKSALQINLQKVEYMSRLAFSKVLFGNHPYRDDYALSHYDAITTEHLHKFFSERYQMRNAICLIAGKDTLRAADLLAKSVMSISEAIGSPAEQDLIPPWIPGLGRVLVPKKDALQSAIRVGLAAPRRNEPDFPAFFVMHTALGGYFGSRLMQNIREEKGYTYGIGSAVTHLEAASYLSISTQVACEYTEATLREIYFEMERLRNDLIGDDEFDLIRNYLAGSLVQSMDGPFELNARLKTIVTSGLSPNHFNHLLASLFELTPEDVRQVAQKWLDAARVVEAIAGKF